MSLSGDLRDEVRKILADQWKTTDGRVVPEAEGLPLSNEAVTLDGAVLYADLVASTQLVNTRKPAFAAEVYKTFLHCAAKIVRETSGAITAYDGDRLMAVYLGNSRHTNAGNAALKINHAVSKLINPLIREQYPKLESDFKVEHCVGVDSSGLFVTRTGVRGANDLVWVGRAANYAAKLCALRDGAYYSWVTDVVFDNMADDVKYSQGKPIWEKRTWTAQGISVYRCSWMREP